MKILVLSDSHGNISNMLQAVEREQPRAVYHLGDCWRDGERLRDRVPDLPLEQVPGNCDYFRSSRETEKLLFLEDKRVLLCHGHTYWRRRNGIWTSFCSATPTSPWWTCGEKPCF